MKLNSKTGDINKGTVIFSLSKAEAGIDQAIIYCDYYMNDKNKYLIDMFASQENSENIYHFNSQKVNCLYSEIKDICKAEIKKLHMKIVFKVYTKIHSMQEEKVKNLGTVLIFNEQRNRTTIKNNIKELAKIKEIALKDELREIEISANIYYIDNTEMEDVVVWFKGNTKAIYSFILLLSTEQLQQYDLEVTYGRYATSLNVIFSFNDEQLNITMNVINDIRYYTKKIEEYFIIHATRVNLQNTYERAYGLSFDSVKTNLKKKFISAIGF